MIKQRHENTCGQACVAELLGITYDEAVAALGKGRTKTKDLIWMLRAYGLHTSPRLMSWNGGKVALGIAKLVWICDKEALQRIKDELERKGFKPKKLSPASPHWHWVLIRDGIIHDPEPKSIFNRKPLGFETRAGSMRRKIISYIRVEKQGG